MRGLENDSALEETNAGDRIGEVMKKLRYR
jgi:hypothetical protein